MRNYGPKGRGFESSNARHIKNGTGHKVLSHFLFESGRTRTGSIYISFRSLLNACHRHAATSNARFGERLETLKNQRFPAFFVLVNLSSNLWLPVTREFWVKSVGKCLFHDTQTFLRSPWIIYIPYSVLAKINNLNTLKVLNLHSRFGVLFLWRKRGFVCK